MWSPAFPSGPPFNPCMPFSRTRVSSGREPPPPALSESGVSLSTYRVSQLTSFLLRAPPYAVTPGGSGHNTYLKPAPTVSTTHDDHT